MILVDANLLVYAKVAALPQHEMARAWLEDRLNAPGRVALPWASLLGFLRLVTNPRVFRPALTIADAWTHVAEWLALPNVWLPAPGDAHAEILARLLTATNAAAELVPDAHVAALALEHGLTVCSADVDFARFPGLRWENPLAPSQR